MRICIITTSYPFTFGPTTEFQPGKFVHDMARSFVNIGFEVHVVTHHGKHTQKNEIADGVYIHRFHYFLPFAESLTTGYGMPENIKKTRNKILVPFYFIRQLFFSLSVVKKFRIDYVHAHWAVPTGFNGRLLKKMTGKKLAITIYGAELFPVIKGKMPFLKTFIASAIKHADIVAAISSASVKAAKNLSGRGDILLIPDGIDTNYYKPGEKNYSILKKYNCDSKNKVIFFTGRMVERKGHIYLLKAISIVKDLFPEIKLILGGKGPLEDDLLKCREDLALRQFVEMPGFIPEHELVSLLQSVDLFVLPSCIDKNGDTEGSATAALEAMACGIPAVISYVGGNVGAIVEGEGAWYFKPASEKDLADKICMVLKNNVTFDNLRMLARSFVVQNYSWLNLVKKYEEKMLAN